MTRAVLPTPATPSYCAAMTVGTMVKRFAHVRFLVDCLWVQLLFTLSVPRDIFRTPALIWGRFIDSGNQVGRTRSDIQAAGPRRCQSQTVLLLLGCKAGLICYQLRRQSATRGRSDLEIKLIECAELDFEESPQPDSVRTRLESGSTGFSKGEACLIVADGVELWGSNPSDVPLLQAPALPESQVLKNCCQHQELRLP